MNYTRSSTALKAILLSVFLTGSLFCMLAFLFTALKILSFNPVVLSGLNIKGLPAKIILFIFTVPILCIMLYRYLNSRFPNNALEKFSLSVSNLILGICIAFLFFGYMKWYTVTAFFISSGLLLYIEYLNKLRFMYRFYRTYLFLLVPFYGACLLVSRQDILSFNEKATLQLKLGAVPIEMYFLFMGMCLMAVYLFERLSAKTTKIDG